MGRAFLAALAVALLTASSAAADTLIYVHADASSGVTKAQLDTLIPAFQTMITRDFAPIWQTWATLTTDPTSAVAADMEIDLLDTSPLAGVLGFHEAFAGRPTAYVFLADCTLNHTAWPLVFAHEAQEMLVDPWIDRVSQDPITGRMWAVEVSDPVQSGYYAYWIGKVPMSDFVTPAWFSPGAPGPFDFMAKLKRPHQVGRHGFMQWYDFDRSTWRLVWG